MGILDDLAMGFGLKERDADYYDRTEQTLRRTQGDARGDIYARQTASVRADLANPAAFGRTGRDRSTFRGAGSNFTSTGGRPQSDPSMRGIFGAPTAMFGGNPSIRDFVPFLGLINQLTMRPRDTGAGYMMNTQRGTGSGTYRAPQSVKPAPATPTAPAPAAAPARSLRPQLRPPQAAGVPLGMEAQYSASPAPLLAAPDVQLEAFTGNPSDPMYRPGGEFDAFVEMTMDFPDFDDIRDNRDLMMDVFQKYKAMHRGAK